MKMTVGSAKEALAEINSEVGKALSRNDLFRAWNIWYYLSNPAEFLCDKGIRPCGCPSGEWTNQRRKLKRSTERLGMF